MDADFSIELGPPSEDATLDFPWDSGSPSGPRYVDLKRHPEMLALVPEAVHYPELRDFLAALNSPSSAFETAKCDVWLTDEITEAEQVYGLEWKMAAYVDLLFSAEQGEARFSFFQHEELARRLVSFLKAGGPELSAEVEIILRRCYYQADTLPGSGDADAACIAARPERTPGFYLTLYVFGFGADERQARARWATALGLLGNCLELVSATARPSGNLRAE
jgi:hypothetical protein